MKRRSGPRAVVTAKLVEQVRALSPGRFQWEVAAELGISMACVATIQKTHAIPHYSRREGSMRAKGVWPVAAE